MEDKYISAKELVNTMLEEAEKLPDDLPKNEGLAIATAAQYIMGYIKRVPSADVQSVIHSRWIATGDGTYNAYCENCGQERGNKSWNKNDFKYCFGCGARMDLKDGDVE